MKIFQKFKEPRTLLVFVIVLAACGFGGLAILSQDSANPARSEERFSRNAETDL